MNNSQHRKQIFWQVYFPLLILFGCVFLIGYYLFGKSGSGSFDIRILSDISILIILLPVIIYFIFAFACIYFTIYAIFRIYPVVGNLLQKSNLLSLNILNISKKVTGTFVHPIIAVESLFSQFIFRKRNKNR